MADLQAQLLVLARLATTAREWPDVPCDAPGCTSTTDGGFVVDGLRVGLCIPHRTLTELRRLLPPLDDLADEVAR